MPCRAGVFILLLGSILALPGQVLAAGRVEAIQARGHLICGITPGIAGFGEIDADGQAHGFDVDICRAVAVAILGNADAVRFVQADAVTQLDTMPDLDLVIRRLTWTLTREGANGLMFGPIVFFDGQGFLVPASSDKNAGLDGKRVCVDPGEDWGRNLRRYSQDQRKNLQILVTLGPADSLKRLSQGECDAYSADKSMLGAVRSTAPRPGDYRILDEEISKEPLAPLMREGDDPFFQIVRWTIFALIAAEELGVTAANAGTMRNSANPDIARLLGRIPGNGEALGLSEDWAGRVIKAVGNYGEIFGRDVGAGSAVKLNRGLNRLWTQGGLMYAPPLR